MMWLRSVRADQKEKRSAVLNIVPGLLMIAVSVLIAIAGLTLVQCLVPPQSRREHNDVAGFIYAVLGVIYAVLMALVHNLMVAVLTLIISSVLFTIGVLEHPFSGDVRVGQRLSSWCWRGLRLVS
jgi:lysylphosphatidylglycerol synthetase-like protein (DUF2156 family)